MKWGNALGLTPFGLVWYWNQLHKDKSGNCDQLPPGTFRKPPYIPTQNTFAWSCFVIRVLPQGLTLTLSYACVSGTSGSPQENPHNNNGAQHSSDSHAPQSRPTERVRFSFLYCGSPGGANREGRGPTFFIITIRGPHDRTLQLIGYERSYLPQKNLNLVDVVSCIRVYFRDGHYLKNISDS